MVSGMPNCTLMRPGPLARNFTPANPEALNGQRMPSFAQLSEVPQTAPHVRYPSAVRCAAQRLVFEASACGSFTGANSPDGDILPPSVVSCAPYHHPSRWKALNGLLSPS